jgi:hypothetical protein
MQLGEIYPIASLLRELDDSQLLESSRRASDFYNYSIYRWAIKRARLVAQGNPVPILIPTHEKGESEYSVPSIGYELLSHLTLRDVRELAHFELPTIQEDIKFGGRFGQDVEITLGALPRSLYMASIFAEALLLFTIMYFYAFTCEAASSTAFPAKGTLFSAFSRSLLTSAVFFVALWTPVVACFTVAVASRELPLAILGSLNIFAVSMVYSILRGKSYFKVLNLGALMSKRGRIF